MSVQLGLKHKLVLGLTVLCILFLIAGAACAYYLSEEENLWQLREMHYACRIRTHELALAFERFDNALHEAAITEKASAVSGALVTEMEKDVAAISRQNLLPDVEIIGKIERDWSALKNAAENLPGGATQERILFFQKFIEPLTVRMRHNLDLLVQSANQIALAESSRIAVQESRNHMFIITVLVIDALCCVLVVAFIVGPAIRPIRQTTLLLRRLQQGELPSVSAGKPDKDVDELVAEVHELALKLKEQRKTDEARLKQMEISVETAINGLSDGVAIISATGQIQAANHAARQLFGIAPGESVESLNIPWLNEIYEQARQEQSGSATYHTALQIFIDRHERFIVPRMTVIRDENKVQGMTLLLADTTMVRQVEEAKCSLIATVSHELKTPLTSIQMAIHLLLDDVLGSLNDKQRELMAAARDDTTRLHQMIEHLLEAGRMSVHSELKIEECSPRELIAHAINFAQADADIRSKVTEDHPRVLADPNQAARALGAIFKCVSLASSKHEAQVTAQPHSSYVDFSITMAGDTCHEHQGQMDEILSLTKEIVTAHGGVFDIQESAAQQLVIRFTLRRADGKPQEKGG